MASTTTLTVGKSDANVPNNVLEIAYVETGTTNKGTNTYSSNTYSFGYPLVFKASLSATNYTASGSTGVIACSPNQIGFNFTSREPNNFASSLISQAGPIFNVANLTKINGIDGKLFYSSFTSTEEIKVITSNGFTSVNGADEITSIVLPSGLLTIGNGALTAATALTTVFLAGDYSRNFIVGASAFYDVLNITFVVNDGQVSKYSEYLNTVFSGQKVAVISATAYADSVK